jgi:hypothetical protein
LEFSSQTLFSKVWNIKMSSANGSVSAVIPAFPDTVVAALGASMAEVFETALGASMAETVLVALGASTAEVVEAALEAFAAGGGGGPIEDDASISSIDDDDYYDGDHIERQQRYFAVRWEAEQAWEHAEVERMEREMRELDRLESEWYEENGDPDDDPTPEELRAFRAVKHHVVTGGGGRAAPRRVKTYKAVDEREVLSTARQAAQAVKKANRFELGRRATRALAADRSAKAVMTAV